LYKVNTEASSFIISMATVALVQQDNGFANGSRFRVPAGHHCVVALGKLLTPVCLWHQAV